MKTKLVLLAFLALTFLLLSGCDLDLTNRPTETPESSPTPTPTETPTPTPTETPSPTPEPAWMTTIKIQDPEGQSFKIENGQPVIDLYGTQTQKKNVLNQESIKITTTTDGLNPNILTALDADGNTYAFNPDYGWFKVPEVQMNYADLTKYTEVEQSFIEDGRANIVTALRYAENPTISPNAANPVIWVSYNNFRQVLTMGLNTAGNLNIAQQKYQEYLSNYGTWGNNPEIKPFAWTGFFKVHLNNGETIYVVSRTLKNPTETNKNQTINLFYGFDQETYENLAADSPNLPGWSSLRLYLEKTDKGIFDFVAILAPPEQFPFNPNTAGLGKLVNPVVGNLQQRQIISLFDQKDNQTIMKVLQEGQQANSLSPLSEPLPDALSQWILFTAFTSR